MIKKCLRCKSDQIITNAGRCTVCGSNVNAPGQEENEQLDLEVREVPVDDREFVGGSKSTDPADQPEKTDPISTSKVKITTPEEESQKIHRTLSYDPIGFSEPTLPPEPENSGTLKINTPSESIEAAKPAETRDFHSSVQFKKLTPEEIKSIEKNLYGKNARLHEKEKSSLRGKINEFEDSAGLPSCPLPRPDRPPLLSETFDSADSDTTATGRGRGVAYFYKNFIKLPDQQHLTKHDELILNGNLYVLQHKKIKPTFLYTGLSAGFALLLFLAAYWLVGTAGNGKGQVAGVVLDRNSLPYIRGATVTLPDLGKSVTSSGQGLFALEDVPEGSHRIEYLVDGRVVGSDHATVVGNSISMLTLRPSTAKLEKKKQTQLASSSASNMSAHTSLRPSDQMLAQNDIKIELPAIEPEVKQASKPKSSAAGIVLAANVNNAKFSLDGTVKGAGNLKYAPITPGKYNYEVDAAGYKKKSGTITITAGETKTLEVNLEPLESTAKEVVLTAEDYFQKGVTALKAGKNEEAISEFVNALLQNPGYPQAVYNGGLAYQQLKKDAEALDDFVKAAEMYRMKKEYGWAITSFNRALEVDSRSIAAILGRGELYLAKSEETAALADFDAVLKMDKRNYQAIMGIGKSRLQQTNYKLALESFKTARSINKDDPYLYPYLMLTYTSLNDVAEVKKAYVRFREIASENQRIAMENDRRFAAALQVAKMQ